VPALSGGDNLGAIGIRGTVVPCVPALAGGEGDPAVVGEPFLKSVTYEGGFVFAPVSLKPYAHMAFEGAPLKLI
jgi:hypothetical protein